MSDGRWKRHRQFTEGEFSFFDQRMGAFNSLHSDCLDWRSKQVAHTMTGNGVYPTIHIAIFRRVSKTIENRIPFCWSSAQMTTTHFDSSTSLISIVQVFAFACMGILTVAFRNHSENVACFAKPWLQYFRNIHSWIDSWKSPITHDKFGKLPHNVEIQSRILLRFCWDARIKWYLDCHRQY